MGSSLTRNSPGGNDWSSRQQRSRERMELIHKLSEKKVSGLVGDKIININSKQKVEIRGMTASRMRTSQICVMHTSPS